jgi:putative endonuclease
MSAKSYYVYILTNRTNSVLYIGVTGSIIHRIHEHKSGSIEGFTKKYHVDRLVYLEETQNVEEALAREKQLKGWSRQKKTTLINSANPDWEDLAGSIL